MQLNCRHNRIGKNGDVRIYVEAGILYGMFGCIARSMKNIVAFLTVGEHHTMALHDTWIKKRFVTRVYIR